MFFVNSPMKQLWLAVGLFCSSWGSISAQNGLESHLREEIAFYADVMINASDARHRERAHGSLKSAMDSLLALPNSYQQAFDSIPWISVLYGADYRVISWQWMVDPETYRYDGYIQTAATLTELKDTRPFINGSAFNTYTPATWYGALYYQLIPFERNGKSYALLLGFNADNANLNTKVADVLDLSGSEPVLGVPVFVGKEDQPMTRLIVQYADLSTVHIRYDSALGGVIHEHLEVLQGVGPNGESLPVSDGSLEGWILTNGDWIYHTEVYDVPSAEPPMSDERKERKEDKDILGRPRKD